ncbi:MAG: LEPR-XLL domain-containing protein [Planctomycetes bacterium]|nr:LEPR-XLL domain-containing protein [Planctomycetota bacterium]
MSQSLAHKTRISLPLPTPFFEALEPRVLLNADLAISWVQIPTAGEYLQRDKLQAVVAITNNGPDKLVASGTLQVYASLNGTLEKGDDILLGSIHSGGSLNAGETVHDLGIKLTIPTTMNPGIYRLITTVVPSGTITGDDPSNNIAVTPGPIVTLPAVFGKVGNRNNVKLVIFDDVADTSVTLSLTGGATGTLVPNGDLADVVITNSNPASVLTVRTLHNAIVPVQNVAADGSLKTIDAPKVDLKGNMTVVGALGSLTLHDVADGHTLSIGPASSSLVATTIKLNDVAEASLTTQMPIKSLTVANWLDTDATPDVITAPAIASLKSTGDFEAGLTITGGNPAAVSLGSAKITGDLNEATWNINAGRVTTIQVGGAAEEWTLNSAGRINTLTLGSAVDAAITALSVGTMTVTHDITTSTILFTQAAPSPDVPATGVDKLTIRGTADHTTINSRSSIGTVSIGAMAVSSLYADINGPTLPDSADDFASHASIKSMTIAGIKGSLLPAFTGSSIAAWTIKKITLRAVDVAGVPAPFGVAGNSIPSYARSDAADPLKRKFKSLTPAVLPNPASLLIDGNFVIRLIG